MSNAIFFLFIAICVGGLIMSNRIKDGIVVKSGLILIALGFFGAAAILIDEGTNLLAPIRLIGFGAVICIFGVFFRGCLTGGQCRRFSDWFEHQTTPRP